MPGMSAFALRPDDVFGAGIANVNSFRGPTDLVRCPVQRTGPIGELAQPVLVEDVSDLDSRPLEPPPFVGYRIE